MFKTKIDLVPTGESFDIYSGLTSSTTFTLVASNVTNTFEHNLNFFDVYIPSGPNSGVTQYYYLRFVSDHCEDLIVKVKIHDLDFVNNQSCVDVLLKYAEAVGLAP
jgi:hypothetical protein